MDLSISPYNSSDEFDSVETESNESTEYQTESDEFVMPTVNRVFTDGSHNKSTKRCGYGVFFGDNDSRNIGEEITEKKTNNIAELTAILKAIEIMIKSDEYKLGNIIEIYSDSEYCIKSILYWSEKWEKNGWKTANNKPVKNKELIQEIRRFYLSDHRIQLLHVKAHQKAPIDEELYKLWYGNNMADKYATGEI